MKKSLLLIGLLLAILVVLSHDAFSVSRQRIFPYPVHKVTLKNGLDVIFIEMPEFKNVLSFNTLVLAGARNETEKGKTGFAHLFEHMMFRHKFDGIENGYDDAINKLGAHNNAWTWFDVTFYHPLTFTYNLDTKKLASGEKQPGLLELEASRFTSLAFDKKIFQTESGAVLGEYRRAATDPGLAISEKMLELAYPNHPYGHTTIGYLQDIIDMPNHYNHAVWFYDTYYRPNNCVIVIAGDIKKDELLPKIESAFSAWQPNPIPTVNIQDPAQTGEKRARVEWNAQVPPRVHVAYRIPKFVTGSTESAVGQALPELLVSESADLYRRLRFEKKTVTSLGFAEGRRGYEGFDPRLINCAARLYLDRYKERGEAYINEVVGDIISGFDELKQFASSPKASEILEIVKSKFKYDFLANLDSPANVAETFAWYYRFERDPDILDKLIDSVQKLTPSDIEAYARKFFVENNRVVVTMTPKGS